MIQKYLVTVLLIVGLASLGVAQNAPLSGQTPVQATVGLYYVTPISQTAGAGGATTLTIPAPPAGFYNYVCNLTLNGSNNNTGAVLTNVTTSTTNFNSFATKFSQISANSNTYDWAMKFGDPSTGCAKSTSPGTATTFVSPNSTNEAYTWTATYFQAP